MGDRRFATTSFGRMVCVKPENTWCTLGSYMTPPAHPADARCDGVLLHTLDSRSNIVSMARHPLQQVCLGVIVGSPILAALFVASRIYTRRKLNLRLGWGTLSVRTSDAETDDCV
jgi:hypothetical protein